MIVLLRSIAFNIAFYGWSLFCCLFFLPTLLLSKKCVSRVAQLWIEGVNFICKFFVGLHYKIEGKEKLASTPCIYAVKHQSAWETLFFYKILPNPSVVLKRELTWIPLFGCYLKKLGMISIHRSKNKALKNVKLLIKCAEEALKRGQSIVIFPEGTRSKPTQKANYHSGIASLYLHLNVPVIPIAHNAGLFWPRRGFLKYSGCITMEVLDRIEPGLSRKKFMSILEDRIETRTTALVHKEVTHGS